MREFWAPMAALALGLCTCRVYAQDSDTSSGEDLTTEPAMTSTVGTTSSVPGLNPNHSYYPPRYSPPFGGYDPKAWRYKPDRIWPQQGFTPSGYGPSYYDYHTSYHIPSTYDWWKMFHRSPSFDQNVHSYGGFYPQSGYGGHDTTAWPSHWYPYYGTGVYQYPTGYGSYPPHYRTYRSYPSYGTNSLKRGEDQTPHGSYYPYYNYYSSQGYYPYYSTSYRSYPYSPGSYPYSSGGHGSYGSGGHSSYPFYSGSYGGYRHASGSYGNGRYGSQLYNPGSYGSFPYTSGSYSSYPYTSGSYGSYPYTSGSYGSYPYTSGSYGSYPYTSGSYGSYPYTSGSYGSYPYGSGSYGSYPYTSGSHGSYPYTSGSYGSYPYTSGNYGSYPHSHYGSSHSSHNYPTSYYGSAAYPNYYARSYYGSGSYYPTSHQNAYPSYGSGYNNPGYTGSSWNCDWPSSSYYKTYATRNTKPGVTIPETRAGSNTQNQAAQYSRRALMEEDSYGSAAKVDQESGVSSRSLRSVSYEDKASYVDRGDLQTPDMLKGRAEDGKLMALMFSRTPLAPATQESSEEQGGQKASGDAAEASVVQISQGDIRQHLPSQEGEDNEGLANVQRYFKDLVQQTRKLSDKENKLSIDKAGRSHSAQQLTTLFLAFKGRAAENQGSEQEVYFDPSVSLTDRIDMLTSFYNMLPKTEDQDQDQDGTSEGKNGSDETSHTEASEDDGSPYGALNKMLKRVTTTTRVSGEQSEGDDVNDLDTWPGDSQFQVKGSVTLDVDLEGKSNAADNQYIQLLKSLV